jgi:cytochrome c oxidase subunit 2
MGENGSIWLPDASSTLAPQVDALWWFVFWGSTILFVGVVIAMIYFATKYRRRDPSYVPEPAHENKYVEMAWIVGPTILVLIVFTWGANVFIKLNTPPPDAYNINVTGQQWSWSYSYPEGIETAGNMVVPVGRPVKLTMSSQDVIHSFFVPEFRIKMDVLPNRYTSVWFEASKADTFQVFCTEYCGTAHSGMLSKIVAVSEAEFQQWLQDQNQDLPPVELGRRTYEQRCQVCHNIDGTRKVGPPLNGVIGHEVEFEEGPPLTADASYIRESITQPMAKIVKGFPPGMPSFASLDKKTVDGLVAFIESLEDK